MDKQQITKRIDEINKEIDRLNTERDKLNNLANRKHDDDKVNDYLQRYQGQQLLSLHSLDEHGIWEVKGEDPNCDFGGSHYQPLLGYLEGTLNNVLIAAVRMNKFWTWGGGGSITKVKDNLVRRV